jgi:hypothetical protein
MIVLLLLALAQDDSSSREADMFGEAAETSTLAAEIVKEARTSTVGDEREKSQLGDSPIIAGGDPFAEVRSDSDLNSTLGAVNDVLDMGAFVYLRAQYDVRDDVLLKSEPFLSNNLLDVYLDGRPSDRVRAFVQGRLIYQPTPASGFLVRTSTAASETLTAALDQLWLKLDLERTVFVTLGRQRIKWGSGRSWNPTDFLNQNARDPLNIFDERLGVDLVKLHVPVESLGWNFYALAAFSGAKSPEEIGGALRAEIVLGEAELALSTAFRKDRPLRFGADLSAAVGPFDVHSELAISRRVRTPFFSGTLDSIFRGEVELMPVQTYFRRDATIVQWVNGIELAIKYSDQDSFYVGAEYFYNGAGYGSSELYPLLLISRQFNAFYVGKNYGSLFVLLPGPGNWNDTTFTLAAIANLSDGSGVARLDYQVALLTYLRFNAFVQMHGGARGEFRFGFDARNVNPLVLERLELGSEGFVQPPPRVSLGVGLSVEI